MVDRPVKRHEHTGRVVRVSPLRLSITDCFYTGDGCIFNRLISLPEKRLILCRRQQYIHTGEGWRSCYSTVV